MIAQPVDPRAQHGAPRRHRLDRHHLVGLPTRRHGDAIAPRHRGGRVFGEAHERDVRQADGAGPQHALFRARAPQMLFVVRQPTGTERVDEDVEALLPVEPPERADDARAAGGARGHGEERREVGARLDQTQLARTAEVPARQPPPLLGADGDDDVEQRIDGAKQRVEAIAALDMRGDEALAVAVLDVNERRPRIGGAQRDEQRKVSPAHREVGDDDVRFQLRRRQPTALDRHDAVAARGAVRQMVEQAGDAAGRQVVDEMDSRVDQG